MMPAAIADGAGHRAFLDNHDPAGLPHRGRDGFVVQRRKAPHVDHLGGDAFRGKPVGRLERVVQHQQPRQHGHVCALAAYKVGTVEHRAAMFEMPDGTVKVLVEGGQRARITGFPK